MRSRLLTLSLALLALAVAAPAASAALPGVGNPPPGPTAAEAKLSVAVASGLFDRKTRYVLQGERLLVTGTIRPFVDGQTVEVQLFRAGKLIGHRKVKVKQGQGGGVFKAVLGIRKAAKYSVRAHHEANSQQKGADSIKHSFRAIRPSVHNGENVRLLQIGLRRLGYVAPLTGRFQDGTARAVLAFRKVNRMSHDYTASRTVFRKLFHGAGTYHLRYPKAGTHVEADLSRQVLVLAAKGRAVQIYSVSSGKPSTPTIQGKFSFYRKDFGTNSHGMVDSSYFRGGYAIHGYASVPATYPASHGCIRVPIPDASRIYNSIRLGETIYVYH